MSTTPVVVWKEPPTLLASLLILLALIAFTFFEGIAELLRVWEVKEEYSYGYLIPFITLFLLWQKTESLRSIAYTGSWAGPVVILAAICLFVIGDLATLYLVTQLSMLLVIAGIALALTGWQGFRIIWVPLLLLAFMVPLPQFFLTEISNQLQLLSSQIGVAVIRLFGISVFLEGNVIDLGAMKLQVVEACSGLRYLFPLMTLGFIAAYFFNASLWKRAVIFLSTVPITVLMNSLRIGIIGVLVEYWGKSMAEGFLHDFEGWAVFMACTAVLIGEMWLLNLIGGEKRPLREVFGLEFPAPAPATATVQSRQLPKTYVAAMALVLVASVTAALLPQRTEIPPARQEFARFPLTLDHWQGKPDRLDQIFLNELKLDDYLLVNYVEPAGPIVSLYTAYYASQKKGQSTHSPRTCIPGGGWKIQSLNEHALDGLGSEGQPLRVNRTVIQHGEQRQLVYYWFQQRGRNITNEYLVKWYIFWDALTRNRTDGALVRVTTPVLPAEDIATADQRLADFLRLAQQKLPEYLPD